MQAVLAALLTLQFVLVTFHDLVDIPGWTHGSQVQARIGRGKVWLVTAINGLFPGLAMALAFWFWNRPKPELVEDYWVLYCALTVLSAIGMWYVPYLFGASEEKKREYAAMYAGTYQLLPARGDNPRPNLLHLAFHVLFVVNLALVLALRFGR
ncbi:MAG TPA: hypothetical protein VGE98_15675 [Thermoanaerobaculia bacterium]